MIVVHRNTSHEFDLLMCYAQKLRVIATHFIVCVTSFKGFHVAYRRTSAAPLRSSEGLLQGARSIKQGTRLNLSERPHTETGWCPFEFSKTSLFEKYVSPTVCLVALLEHDFVSIHKLEPILGRVRNKVQDGVICNHA